MSNRSKSAGQIKVHRSDYLEEVTRDAFEQPLISKDDSNVKYSYSSMDKNHKLHKIMSSNLVNGWLSEKSIKSVQEKIDFESRDITNMYLSLLANEQSLKKDLNEILENDLAKKSRKVHWLIQNWYEKTYAPLDRRIGEEMDSTNFRKLDKEKRKQFIKYLNHRNKKGHVFLDVFEEEEYDPLYLNKQRPGPIKVVTEKLSDPLLHQQHKRNEEDRIAIACDVGVRLTDKEIQSLRLPRKPLVPLGRHDTECSTWLRMKLHDIQSDVRVRSQERLYGMRNVSTACLHDLPKGEIILPEIFNRKDKWRTRRQFPDKYDTSIELI